MSGPDQDKQPEAPSANEDITETQGPTEAQGPESEAPAAPESLTQQLESLEAQLAAAKDAQLRTVAEMENQRKRLEREAANASKYGAEKLLNALLGVADSLDLGLVAASKPEADVASLIEGMELTRKQLSAVLEKNGVSPVESEGQPFNPDFHEAMTMVPTADVPPNHVIEVVQKGYTLHDRLLRPAMVVVAKSPPGEGT